MHIGLLTIRVQLSGCASLKEKRGQIKPVLARLHREFNVSVAEVGYQDRWNEAIVAVTIVGSDPTVNHQTIQGIVEYFEKHWPDLTLLETTIETR